MTIIDFDLEAIEIIHQLDMADEKSIREKIITDSIKKQRSMGTEDEKIIVYLFKLSQFLSTKIESSKNNSDGCNYSYTIAFVESLWKTPDWIKSIDK